MRQRNGIMAKLRVISGRHRGATFELTAERVTVGRDSDNAIRLPDTFVSRHHAEFVREGNAYRLRDLHSTNGSYVDGKRVGESPVSNGSRIRLADVELEFHADAPPAAATSPGANSPGLAKPPSPIAAPVDRGVWRPPKPPPIPDPVKPPGPRTGGDKL